jgi:hypothetical protein
MKDRIRTAHRVDMSSNANTATEIADRRAAPRQHFVAEAMIVEVRSGVKLSARSCDLVVHGCYVDTIRPFPVGTLVRIRLKKDETTVEVNGNVVYELPGLGMGIAFHDLTPESHAAVDKWLSHLPGHQDSLESLMPPIDPEPATVIQRQHTTEFVDLIQLLKKKGILTKAEALGLLKEPLDE